MLTCPRCGSLMETLEVRTYNVERCTSCGGMFFDAAEEEILLQSGPASAIDTHPAHAVGASDEPLLGPKDGARMMTVHDAEQPHVSIERCTLCYGSFYDAGELRDIESLDFTDLFRRFRRS